jgi:hypothetical protein
MRVTVPPLPNSEKLTAEHARRVVVRELSARGYRVETRLFVHFDATTWVGFSYQWDEAQTDATIVADERVEEPFNTGSRSAGDCVWRARAIWLRSRIHRWISGT